MIKAIHEVQPFASLITISTKSTLAGVSVWKLLLAMAIR